MRYLLDTNILSEATKPHPSAALLTWMAEQENQDLFIAAITVAEIRRGVLEKPSGRRRDQLGRAGLRRQRESVWRRCSGRRLWLWHRLPSDAEFGRNLDL